jgi:ABC-type nitrate/sulfonate/bicarbonate transport system permease component
VRQNSAIGWVMLTAAEGLSRSEGGLGVLLLNGNKQFNLASVFAIQFLIMTIGMLQDFSLGAARNLLFPWSDLAQGSSKDSKGGK